MLKFFIPEAVLLHYCHEEIDRDEVNGMRLRRGEHFNPCADAIEETRQDSTFVILLLELEAFVLKGIHELVSVSAELQAKEYGMPLSRHAQRYSQHDDE